MLEREAHETLAIGAAGPGSSIGLARAADSRQTLRLGHQPFQGRADLLDTGVGWQLHGRVRGHFAVAAAVQHDDGASRVELFDQRGRGALRIGLAKINEQVGVRDQLGEPRLGHARFETHDLLETGGRHDLLEPSQVIPVAHEAGNRVANALPERLRRVQGFEDEVDAFGRLDVAEGDHAEGDLARDTACPGLVRVRRCLRRLLVVRHAELQDGPFEALLGMRAGEPRVDDERGAEIENGLAHRLRRAHLAIPRRVACLAEAAGDPGARQIGPGVAVAELHEQCREGREAAPVVHRTIRKVVLVDVIVADHDAGMGPQQTEDHLVMLGVVADVVDEDVE